jgi:glycosyltransferase involved in cell wall biosynthesis
MSVSRYRVLGVASHPVQYAAPIFRRMARHPQLDFQVAYCSLRGAENAHDPEFGTTVKWDLPLLEGYSWTQVPNRAAGVRSFLGLRNPGIWKLIRSGNFDAVLCYTGYLHATFWISYLAAKVSGAAFLFGTDAVALTPRDGSRWKLAVKRLLWPVLFRMADQVIVPSSGSRDLMLSLGLPKDRVTLTPYVVDNDWWVAQSSRIDRAAVRASWGASADDTVILFCAKLQPWKRPFDLLRAFAKARLQKARLIFVGDGPLRPGLESEVVALGISDRVRFLGFLNQSQLPEVYKSADLMVLPSAYEPFAVVVNEAMCCGCPVMASDRVGAARDLIAPIAPDFVFRSGEVDVLAELLSRIVGDEDRLQKVSRDGLARMRSWGPDGNVNASVEAVREAVFRLYGKVANPPKPSSAPAPESPASSSRR